MLDVKIFISQEWNKGYEAIREHIRQPKKKKWTTATYALLANTSAEGCCSKILTCIYPELLLWFSHPQIRSTIAHLLYITCTLKKTRTIISAPLWEGQLILLIQTSTLCNLQRTDVFQNQTYERITYKNPHPHYPKNILTLKDAISDAPEKQINLERHQIWLPPVPINPTDKF